MSTKCLRSILSRSNFRGASILRCGDVRHLTRSVPHSSNLDVLILSLLLATGLLACSTNTPTPDTIPPTEENRLAATVNPIPTAAETAPVEPVATCADIEANWGQDWQAVIDVLEALIASDQTCGEEPLLSKKYAAHFNYAVMLEESDTLDSAVAQYQAALFIDPQRQEALDALLRLEALPKPTPAACLSTSSPRPDPAPSETPDLTLFVTVQDNQLQLAGQPFKVKGVNYYPRRAPWERFLNEVNPSDMAQELDVIKQAGFNTIRIFLWHQSLFTCQPDDAIPLEAAFATLDQLFQLSHERDLKVIVTLNDLPDLVFRPLYTDWDHYDAQIVYIVRRYRNEPNILAWDLRNGGNFDYSDNEARFSQEEVLDWLAHAAQLVRDNAPYHLVTAGWSENPTVTAPYVDLLSFQHWAEADDLQARLKDYEQTVNKPLILEAVGYHSWAEAPDEPQTEQDQAERLAEIMGIVHTDPNLSGWLIWIAFDFTPGPGQSATDEHFFGLWRTDLTPKPALEELPLQ